MRTLALFILTFFLVEQMFATPQAPDILIYRGDTMRMYGYPITQLKNVELLRGILFAEKEGCVTTACGYVAEWEVIDNQLFLTNIYSCCYSKDSIKADLKLFFKEKVVNGKVKADWFTGSVFSPQGRELPDQAGLSDYAHNGLASSFHERELELRFEEGYLMETKCYDTLKQKYQRIAMIKKGL